MLLQILFLVMLYHAFSIKLNFMQFFHPAFFSFRQWFSLNCLRILDVDIRLMRIDYQVMLFMVQDI